MLIGKAWSGAAWQGFFYPKENKMKLNDEMLEMWLEDLNDDIDRYSDKVESVLWKALWVLLTVEIIVQAWRYFNG